MVIKSHNIGIKISVMMEVYIQYSVNHTESPKNVTTLFIAKVSFSILNMSLHIGNAQKVFAE